MLDAIREKFSRILRGPNFIPFTKVGNRQNVCLHLPHQKVYTKQLDENERIENNNTDSECFQRTLSPFIYVVECCKHAVYAADLIHPGRRYRESIPSAAEFAKNVSSVKRTQKMKRTHIRVLYGGSGGGWWLVAHIQSLF